MADDLTATVAGRFAGATVERLDRLAEAMSKAAAGARVTRSDALRIAVEEGLPVLEARFGLSAEKGGARRPSKPRR
jgi:hypothetical protein